MTILFLVSGLIAGVIIGYLIKKTDNGYKQKNEELQQALENTRSELDEYKQQVAGHFLKTADLVNNMTDSYRAVHEHLATGATTLCSEQLGVEKLDIKQTHLLEKTKTENTLEGSTVEATDSGTTIETSPETPDKTPLNLDVNTEEKVASEVQNEEIPRQPIDAIPDPLLNATESDDDIDKKTVH